MKRHHLPLLITLLLAAAIARAPGAPEEAAALAVLSSDAGLYEKAMACNDLALVGSAKAVPALAKLLGDEKLHDYARNGLGRIDDPAAGEALLAALDTLEGNQRIGVVLTLGDRAEVAAVPALQKMATDSSDEAADAALSSLGQIATGEATETILAVLNDGDPESRIAAAHAALVAAEQMAKAGRSAAALLDAVRTADIPSHVKAAVAGK